jgi:ceramide glucosyltransferase
MLLPSYPALFAATPLLLALSSVGAARGDAVAIAAGALAIAARLFVALFAARAAGRALGVGALVRDVVLADALLLAAFARAMTDRRVVWRGVPFLEEAKRP